MRRAELRIDRSALRHNAEIARRAAGDRKILAAVKADGYGHGAATVAETLRESVDGLMVASLGEGEALRQAGVTLRIVVLQGVTSQAEARRAAKRFLEPVFHHESQIAAVGTVGFGLPLTAWVKLDSGMHRVGFTPAELPEAYARLRGLRGIRPHPGVLTHFARADEPDRSPTDTQIATFRSALASLDDFSGETSLCNSAGLLAFPEAGGDWVRPGIMLYGGNPFVTGTATDHGLRPVMTLTTRLIAVRTLRAGEPIGYGGRFVAPETMPVGVAAIGYGDGYPRHAPDGTPIVVNGQRAAVIGRVSMDLVTIDLRGIQAQVGDEVECWGAQLPIDAVAGRSGTISYELMCQMSGRVQRIVTD
ncbi:alanine racemase [Halothiobacillus diazotrophicus]|uniref:Alanine racemase n=1 Tax=Halothiobacillus diazotrophicus TaxID=1860122 RepID=A0A191ZDP1_9GAMM|nr:alanine racemase [Halothiobacillus diazotrophicus]ANJ65985.1 alanine racemase [Halothiobacillus diazotrophicus]